MSQEEVYVSVDIEATGPIPGPYSMISLGADAVYADGTPVGTFDANLQELPFSSMDPSTQKFWDENPTAWERATRNARPPAEVMKEFVEWAEKLPGKPVFCAYPLGFDFTFVYWYMHFFAGRSAFSFSGIDMKTYAMAVLKTPFRETTKRRFPKELIGPEPVHPHFALEDAKEQTEMFVRLLKFNGVTRENAVLEQVKP